MGYQKHGGSRGYFTKQTKIPFTQAPTLDGKERVTNESEKLIRTSGQQC